MTKARTLADNYAADINQVSAGVGITGGGTSGTVTITNDMATSINAKGDLVVGTANDTYSRLAVASTAGYLLTVDSAEATGLKWGAPPASGGMTLITSSSVGTGTTVTFSNIFATSYKQLYLVGKNIYANGDNRTMSFTPLDSNDNVCDFGGVDVYFDGTGVGTASADGFYQGSAKIFTKLPTSTGAPDTSLNFQMLIYAANLASTQVGYNFQSFTNYGNPIGHNIVGKITSYGGSIAINKLKFSTNGGNFASGTIYLYGIN